MRGEDKAVHYLKLQAAPAKGWPYDKLVRSLDAARPVFDGLKKGYTGTRIQEVHIRHLACLFKEHLGWGRPAIYEEALMPFFGKIVGPLTIRRMLMRILANKAMLLKTGRFPKWTGHPPLWTYMEVLDCVPYRDRRTEKQLASVKFLSCSGVTAGTVYLFRLTHKYAKWLLKEVGGCPRFEPCSPQELTGMRLYVQLGINSGGRFHILNTTALDAQKKHNRALRKSRIEHINSKTNKKCPMKADCWVCPFGRDLCRTACREFSRRKDDNASKEDRAGQVVLGKPGHPALVPSCDKGRADGDGGAVRPAVGTVRGAAEPDRAAGGGCERGVHVGQGAAAGADEGSLF